VTDSEDRRLASALRDLGSRLEVPLSPEVSAAVWARIEAEPALGSRYVPRWAVAAVAVILALAAASIVSPAVRATVLDVLRFAGVELRSEPGPPARQQSLLPGERAVDLDQARRSAAFPISVPTALGQPDEVHLSDARVVSLIYRAGPGRPVPTAGDTAVRLDEFDGLLEPVFEKFAGMSGGERVRVGGEQGIWIEGPHEVMYVDRAGEWRTETARLAARTLIWQQGNVTLRLEGQFTLAQALEVASTVR